MLLQEKTSRGVHAAVVFVLQIPMRQSKVAHHGMGLWYCCRTSGGDKVEAWLCGPEEALVPASVTDLKNGSYCVEFCVAHAGAWTLKPRVHALLIFFTRFRVGFRGDEFRAEGRCVPQLTGSNG